MHDAEKHSSMTDYARKLLRYFVANCEPLYGPEFVVYNVHGLLHVADDVQYFGTSLDNVSAFKYENYLQTIKRLVRGASNPIAQVSKRLHEHEYVAGSQFPFFNEAPASRACRSSGGGVVDYVSLLGATTDSVRHFSLIIIILVKILL